MGYERGIEAAPTQIYHPLHGTYQMFQMPAIWSGEWRTRLASTARAGRP